MPSRRWILKSLLIFRFEDEDDYAYEIWLRVFSRIVKILTSRKASFYHISPEKLAPLSLVKEVTPSPDRKMIKFPTFDNLFRHHDIRAKTRSRMATATTFSRQNDAGSRASTTYSQVAKGSDLYKADKSTKLCMVVA